MKEIQVGLIRN